MSRRTRTWKFHDFGHGFGTTCWYRVSDDTITHLRWGSIATVTTNNWYVEPLLLLPTPHLTSFFNAAEVNTTGKTLDFADPPQKFLSSENNSNINTANLSMVELLDEIPYSCASRTLPPAYLISAATFSPGTYQRVMRTLMTSKRNWKRLPYHKLKLLVMTLGTR
jgi:hypothetical protein